MLKKLLNKVGIKSKKKEMKVTYHYPGTPSLSSEFATISGSAVDNPKDKSNHKVSTSCIPTSALIEVAKVMESGVAKHGPFNWRQANTKVVVTEYLDAMDRHRLSYLDGEDYVPELKEELVSHLAAIAADCLVLLDAQLTNPTCVIDNRPLPGIAHKLLIKKTKTNKGK